MPYKDPERKRQWEREHQAERTARRRAARVAVPASSSFSSLGQQAARVEALPAEKKKGRSGLWWLLGGLAAIFGLPFLILGRGRN